MKIVIKRFNKDREPQNIEQIYEVDGENITLLKALQHIKKNIDATLTFSSGCRSGVCGSCAVRVNGVEKLSCSYKVEDKDIIEPLNRVEVIKDLVVNKAQTLEVLKRVKTFLVSNNKKEIDNSSMKMIDRQSNCILCLSCHSVCPVLDVKPNFISAFALTRSLRYQNDIRESESSKSEKIGVIQQDGVWDCTMCSGCTFVCPQGIDPKMDITMLQSKSTQAGFSNPYFSSSNFGMDFGGDFGFNP
jgi:fumarate reductase iron-sulfur subunit